MRPILSATGTYNYPLAKWLDKKLKSLSTNTYTISDIFQFSQDIRNTSIGVDHILVSYDVTALFTNVPAHETITILVEKDFSDNWFNDTYDLNLTKDQLRELHELATTNQLFQLDVTLYEQVEGVAMGSPLGSLLANTFMCSIEEKLEEKNELSSFYKRYVDDTLAIMPDLNEANIFLNKLNSCHRNLKFTMEIAKQNTIPFVGMNITKSGNRLETSFYRKSTNTGLLLYCHSHVDKRYKDCLLATMIHRAYQLSSTPTAFSAECNKLRSTFLNLDYPNVLINSAINKFLRNIDNIDAAKNTRGDTLSSIIVVPLPFKDQQSANSVKKQMKILSANIGIQIKPVFQTKKIDQILALKEKKPPIVNNQCVVYKFECDLCDADYVGSTKLQHKNGRKFIFQRYKFDNRWPRQTPGRFDDPDHNALCNNFPHWIRWKLPWTLHYLQEVRHQSSHSLTNRQPRLLQLIHRLHSDSYVSVLFIQWTRLALGDHRHNHL
ncbi:hypothetical protein AWC38_SpisGene11202 [Stylophora pistillata]|uniref:Reverse transcriptase domain-containing protein n=1 Tax=Stylophora pistillata TaxID=50429 RepID=A0A2B4S576_STYPI|nr:hypothetical protein AWC38_SpisGene11202 [Stylophora pistillata]